MDVLAQELAQTACPGSNATSWCSSAGKRSFDLVLASLFLVLSVPLQTVICIVIKLSGQGPVLFRQVRIGRRGTPFVIYKYRTMSQKVDSDSALVTRANDPRITRIGKLLRRTKLDELPQLANILRGEMSFVGPRPRVPAQQSYLLLTRPGLTGIASLIFAHEEQFLQQIPENAQEQYHADVLDPQKQRYDLQYSETASLRLDIEIILRTAFKIYLSPSGTEKKSQPIAFKTKKR